MLHYIYKNACACYITLHYIYITLHYIYITFVGFSLVGASLDKMLHDDYLCLVESGKQQMKEVTRKFKRKTWKQRQLLSESGFVLRTAPPSLSRDRRIKMKKSINQHLQKCLLHQQLKWPNDYESGQTNDFKNWYSQLPCLTLSIKGSVWRTSPQVYLLCCWERHLARLPHLGVVDR